MTRDLVRQAIPHSAFNDAIKDYEGNPETNNDGSMIEA